MDRTARQEKKDAAHMWFGLAMAAVITAGVAFALWRNGQEADRVRAAAYAGRTIEPARGPVVLVAVLTVAVAATIAVVWWRTVRDANAALASTPDEAELDHVFAGADQLVSVQAGHAGMSHSVLVVGARQRGYELSSQGADGSMVFERSGSLLGERTGQGGLPAEQPQDEPA